MAELLAIISKAQFEASGAIAEVGQRFAIDRYTSTNKALKPLAEAGSSLWLVTVRPGERLWLVGLLVGPQHDGTEWIAPAANAISIIDITRLRDRLVFASGKGIARGGAMGPALQTPRALAASDVRLLEGAIAGATPIEGAAALVEAAPVRPWNERETLAHRLEVAKSGRSKCATCEIVIAKGEVRLAEIYQHGDLREPIYRFHHVPCAVRAVPLVLRPALRDAGLAILPDRANILAEIDARVDELASEKRERYAAAETSAAPTSIATDQLYAQVAEDPEDAGALTVLADELGRLGDPRGELITVMLALAAETERTKATAKLVTVNDEIAELVKRRDELIAQLAPRFDATDRAIWGVGFVRRLELRAKTATRLDEMASLWRNPSLALVRELRIEFESGRQGPEAMPGLIAYAPKTFTRVELGHDFEHSLGDVAGFVAVQTKLAALALAGKADLGALAHPTLAELTLWGNSYDWAGDLFAQVVGQIAPARVPAVTALKLVGNVITGTWLQGAPVCGVIAARGWLQQLDTLTLAKLNLDAQAISELGVGLGKRKLARLDVATCNVEPGARAALAALCTELAFPAAAIAKAAAEATHAEHTGKPEWGVGKITSRKDGKVEIKFSKAVGVKVFKADAMFLKFT